MRQTIDYSVEIDLEDIISEIPTEMLVTELDQRDYEAHSDDDDDSDWGCALEEYLTRANDNHPVWALTDEEVADLVLRLLDRK